MEADYNNVMKIDERRDGEEYSVAFAFTSPDEDVVVEMVPYVGEDFMLEPYTPSFSLSQRRGMR